MKKHSTLLLATVITAFTFTVSCKKKEVDKDTQSSVDYTLAEAGYSGVLPVINQIGIDEEGLNKANTCADITIHSGDTTGPFSGPVTFKVDYGTTGCSDYDGRTKKGVIYATFNDAWRNTGATVDITFENYDVDGMVYDGAVQVTNNGNNSYAQVVTGGKCETANWTILYEGTSTFDWVVGENTPEDPNDDVFHFTNNSTCTNRNDETFEVSTESPVIKRNSCTWIESGILSITPAGKATRTFDFGDGTCDNIGTVTINGNTFEFEMQ